MLPLILAAAFAAPSPAPGTYTYLVSLNGAQILKTSVTVTNQPGGNIVLTESGSGTLNGRAGAIRDALTLDASLAPVSYTSQASLADSRSMQAALAFSGGQARQSGDVSKTYELVADAKHFVVLDFGPFSGYFAFPAQMQAWRDQPVVAIVPMYAQGVPIVIDRSAAAARPKSVPSADTQVSVSAPVQFTVWYNPRTLVVDELIVPSEGAKVVRQL